MFRSLFFVQGSEALVYLDMLEQYGAAKIVEFLADDGLLNFHGELRSVAGCGDDMAWQRGRYLVSWNARLSYVGVEYFHFCHEVDRRAA